MSHFSTMLPVAREDAAVWAGLLGVLALALLL